MPIHIISHLEEVVRLYTTWSHIIEYLKLPNEHYSVYELQMNDNKMLFHNIWVAKLYLIVTENWLWVFNMASCSCVMFSYFPRLNTWNCFIISCWVGYFELRLLSHSIQHSKLNIIEPWLIKLSIPLSNSSYSSYLQLNDRTHVEIMKMLFNRPATFSRQYQCS